MGPAGGGGAELSTLLNAESYNPGDLGSGLATLNPLGIELARSIHRLINGSERLTNGRRPAHLPAWK